MANPNFKPLPAPHAAVHVSAARFEWGIWIEYRGPSLAALLEAGCVSQFMLDRLDGRSRRDAEGDYFRRQKRPTQAQPDRCAVIRMIRFDTGGEAKAMALPGVAAYLAREAAPTVAAASEPAKRTRAVGRFRRLVSWLATDNVIVPDWPAIRARTIVDRLGDAS